VKPGELLLGEGPIELNTGRPTVEITVENRSDHTVFISSHFPFFEVNRRLVFDRAQAWGMRLDRPAGDAECWRPGEVKRVRLVAYAGRGVVRGFNGLTNGRASPERLAEGLDRARLRGFSDGAAGTTNAG
jgi:urease subunit gamma/beta